MTSTLPVRLLPAVALVLAVASGCAKQELVKKEEPLVTAAAQPARPAEQQPAPSRARGEAPQAAAPVERQNSPQPAPPGRSEPATPATALSSKDALSAIYFEYDSTDLGVTARETLAQQAALLKKEPRRGLRIEGHCDERGSDEYNLALGERRAQAAARYLSAMGIAANRLDTISYGKEKPADPGHDDTAWARNRRDELIVTR